MAGNSDGMGEYAFDNKSRLILFFFLPNVINEIDLQKSIKLTVLMANCLLAVALSDVPTLGHNVLAPFASMASEAFPQIFFFHLLSGFLVE